MDASNAPVRTDRIIPECAGKVLDSWNTGTNMNDPPSPRNKYPGI